MNAVDTNILIYTHDPRDEVKQAVAVALIGTLPDGVLLGQVACEYVAASRKLAAYGHNQTAAWQESFAGCVARGRLPFPRGMSRNVPKNC